MSISEDIAKFLASKGLGTLGTNIGPRMPPLPDSFMSVRPYPGRSPMYAKTGPPAFRYPRFQVACRSKDPRAAILRLGAATGHLSGFSGLMNGTAYASIREVGEPGLLGEDDSGRETAVHNFEAIR